MFFLGGGGDLGNWSLGIGEIPGLSPPNQTLVCVDSPVDVGRLRWLLLRYTRVRALS